MQFEWDSDKAVLNVEKHGINFELAAFVFLDDERLIGSDDSFDYGEERLITRGHLENRLHVIIYTETGDTIYILHPTSHIPHPTSRIPHPASRIISARKANKTEQARYANS